MPNYGFTKQKLSMLDACSPVDVSKQTMAILEPHLLLSKEEQKEFAEAVVSWSEKNAGIKPTHHVYARLLHAYCLFMAEDYDAALPLLNEVEEQLKDLGDFDSAMLCHLFRGSIYRTNGNFDLALHSLLASEAQFSNAPLYIHPHLAALINIAGIYLDTQHYDEAIAPYKKAIELATPGKRYYWIIYALTGLGKVYVASNDLPAAEESFQKALDAAELFEQPNAVANALGEKGNYYFNTGNLTEAEALTKKALDIREQHNYPGGAITNCIRLGEIYIRQDRFDEARAILEKGLVLATKLGVKLKMYQVHALLSELFERKNDLSTSLTHFKIYNNLREQVQREDSARNIKNSKTVFEAEKTREENAIIKKQKEVIEKKNIELQETIDKLTRARIGKKAKAITLVIAIGLFLVEDFILHSALTLANTDNYFISIVIKIVIIFSLSPINKAIEGYLLKKVMQEKKHVLV